jgi:polynucleotide 5'-kinase involved in rRNA processing
MASDSKGSGGKERMEAPDIHCPDAWPQLFAEIVASPGCIFMLGAPDTGKSTFAHFLCSQSIQRGLRTAYIDGDLGQSVFSPPTTLGMALPTEPPPNLEAVGWDCLYFIGALSPANHLLPTAVGIKRLTHKALEAGTQMVVVDTSGLVAGELGFALKFYKIELLCPRHIVAIQKTDEVEHILKGVHGRKAMEVHRLAPSPGVQVRSPEIRRAYRKRRFAEYFSGSSLRTVSLNEVEFICPGLPLIPVEEIAKRFQGTVLGLIDEEYLTRGLGILSGLDLERNEVAFTTPLPDLQGIRYLHLGHITLTISP